MAVTEWYRNGLTLTPSAEWLVVGGAILVLVLVLSMVLRLRRRTEIIRRFGREYERAVEDYGSERAALQELGAREQHVRKLRLRSLNGRQANHVNGQWQKVLATFVENPICAIRGANALIKSIMVERGFGAEAFEQRLADLSVDHAAVVDHYRAARALSEPRPGAPEATEELRLAMLHYATVIEELTNPTAKAVAAFRELHAT